MIKKIRLRALWCTAYRLSSIFVQSCSPIQHCNFSWGLIYYFVILFLSTRRNSSTFLAIKQPHKASSGCLKQFWLEWMIMTILHIGKVEKKFAAEQLYTGCFCYWYMYIHRLGAEDMGTVALPWLSPNFIVDQKGKWANLPFDMTPFLPKTAEP